MTASWLTLVPLALVMSVGAALSYSRFRGEWWFVPAVAGLCVANGVLWALACKWADSTRSIYSMSAAYDFVTIVCYTVLPLALFGVKLNLTGWLGLALVAAGTLLIKWDGR